MVRPIPLLVLVGGLILCLSGARAEEGILNAVALKPLPEGVPITVRPMDNSDENLILQKEFERELRLRGYTVAEGAPLIMTFETRDTLGAWTSGERRSVLEFEGGGDGIGGDNYRARLNLFDSGRGGMLNEGQGRNTSIVTPSQYRVDLNIDDRETGKRLWQAWATADLKQSDGLTLTRAMVPVLVESLGRTTRRRAFNLQ